MAAEEGRAAIWEIDRAHRRRRGSSPSGLRNPERHGAGSRDSGALWTAVNERDELGSDLVPDYMTSVQDGGFYGWPYSYYGQHVDERVKPQRPDLVAKAIVARLRARPAHRLARAWRSTEAHACRRAIAAALFVGQHGSWNRKPRSGYKVIFVPFADGKPSGQPDRRAHRLPQRGRRGARAARSAWRSTRPARCWSPTMSATRSGG